MYNYHNQHQHSNGNVYVLGIYLMNGCERKKLKKKTIPNEPVQTWYPSGTGLMRTAVNLRVSYNILSIILVEITQLNSTQ